MFCLLQSSFSFLQPELSIEIDPLLDFQEGNSVGQETQVKTRNRIWIVPPAYTPAHSYTIFGANGAQDSITDGSCQEEEGDLVIFVH